MPWKEVSRHGRAAAIRRAPARGRADDDGVGSTRARGSLIRRQPCAWACPSPRSSGGVAVCAKIRMIATWTRLVVKVDLRVTQENSDCGCVFVRRMRPQPSNCQMHKATCDEPTALCRMVHCPHAQEIRVGKPWINRPPVLRELDGYEALICRFAEVSKFELLTSPPSDLLRKTSDAQLALFHHLEAPAMNPPADASCRRR